MTSRLSPRNSSKSNSTPRKNIDGTEAFFNEVLDDIPFEIEGHYNSMVPAVAGSWNFSQAVKSHPVSFPGFNSTSSPLKRHFPEDMKIEKKIKMESSVHVDHSKNASSDEEKTVFGEVENNLQTVNQFKSLTSSKKQNMNAHLFETVENDLQFTENTALENSVKERLLALRFDHCYSNNVGYFERLDEEDNLEGIKEGKKTIDENGDDYFEANLNETPGAKDNEGKLLHLKTEDDLSEHEKISAETFPVSETQENIEGKESFDDDFEEEEFNDEIGPLDDDELLKSDLSSPFAQDSGQFHLSIDSKQFESSPSSDKVVGDFAQMERFQDETEELLAEEYDELDSLEKKEIEEQLSEDFDDEDALDVSVDETSSFSSFDFESLHSNFLLEEAHENLVIHPPDIKTEACLDLENLKAEFSFRSDSERSDQLLGSDGNSSPSSDGSISPPPGGESKEQFTLDDLVRQSEYFQTRPSVLKMWKAKDQSLEVDKNLPAGWRMKVYTRKSGRLDIHYITPENMDVKTKFGVMEYMRLSRNYSVEEVERVAEYLRVRSDHK